ISFVGCPAFSRACTACLSIIRSILLRLRPMGSTSLRGRQEDRSVRPRMATKFREDQRQSLEDSHPAVEAEVVRFLRGWLPESVKDEYRKMIEANPSGWHKQPHFRDRIVVLHLLRGNGISEASLGIRSFD